MAKKSFSSKSTINWSLVIAIIAFAVAAAALLRSTSAAVSVPTGSISLNANSNLKFGGTATYDATVSGLKRGSTYITTYCYQGSDKNIVYQFSNGQNDLNPTITFMQLDGLKAIGLIWDPTLPATCYASLVYRVDTRNNPTIQTIATTAKYTVAAQ